MNDSNYKTIMKLLEKQSEQSSIPDNEVECIKHSISEVLNKYGIEVDRLDSIVSPSVITIVITLLQNKPVSEIRKYTNDIENDLGKDGLFRVIGPISGENALAVEVPRSNRQLVLLTEILESKEFIESKAILPIALGISAKNKPIIADLHKMHHILVGGVTSMGKTILLHSIIVSLLSRKSPNDVKFMLIDPKIGAFEHYSKIKKQYLIKIEGIDEDIITSPEHIITALNSLRSEMDRRYELLRKTECRTNREYTQKLKAGKLLTADGYKHMPYLIVVIDEFADLMIAHGKEIEIPLGLLAQKGHAVGIHIIIATQRLSHQVITGILKANFPARIAFKVHTIVDSRTILDTKGAHLLKDKGDILIEDFSNDFDKMIRAQSAFITEAEVEKICYWIAHNQSDCKPYVLPTQSRHEIAPLRGDVKLDILFERAARMIVSYDIDNIINWNKYYVSGDIEEIKKIARVIGIINIGVNDLIHTLSTTNTNYITSGNGTGPKRIPIALKHAIDRLPVKLQDIEKMIVYVWINKCNTVSIREIGTMARRLGISLREIDIIWGVALDPHIDEDVKITLIAVNKHKLC